MVINEEFYEGCAKLSSLYIHSSRKANVHCQYSKPVIIKHSTNQHY